MKHLDGNKVGLVVGGTIGLWHLVWAILVALGFAQPLMDFVLQLHSLNNPFTVAPFNLTNSVLLVVVTFVFGYILGWVFAWLWDYLEKK